MKVREYITSFLLNSVAGIEGFTTTSILMYPIVSKLVEYGVPPKMGVALEVAIPAIVGLLKLQIAAYAYNEYLFEDQSITK